MRRYFWLGLLVFLAGPSAAMTSLECENPLFRVRSDTVQLSQKMCDRADEAAKSLAACNVRLVHPIEIVIHDHLPENCVGVYHCGANRIELLRPSTLAETRSDTNSAFAGIANETYFNSILTHELTHAAFDTVPCPFGTCLTTAEYVAYTMQVRSMPEQDRVVFEASFDKHKRVSRDELNPFILLMAPPVFTRKAWAHFSQRPDGCAYIGQIMRGDVILDHERP